MEGNIRIHYFSIIRNVHGYIACQLENIYKRNICYNYQLFSNTIGEKFILYIHGCAVHRNQHTACVDFMMQF